MNDVSFTRDPSTYMPLSLPTAVEPAESAAGPLIAQYLRIVIRWRWLILGAIVISLLIGVLATLLATPQFTAATRLEISREGNRIVDVKEVTPEATAVDSEFYQTQYGLLASRSLAERVVRQLRLQDNAAFFEMFSVDDVDVASRTAVAQQDRVRKATDVLLERARVEPIRLSRLVDIEWTGPDPSMAAQIANTWATSFIEFNLERRFEATSYARRFLEQRLEQLRRRLAESERQLVSYASSQAIINVPTGAVDAEGRTPERSLTVETLAALNQELARATGDRVKAESRLAQGRGSSAEAVVNPAVVGLRQRRAEAAAEYARLMTQFEPGYPPAEALAAQVRQLDQSIEREEGRVSNSIRNAYQDAGRRERELTSQVEMLKRDFLDQRRRSIQYNIFQRDVDTNRELYNGLLQRYKEIGVAGGVGENNIAVVDRARVPERPSSPRPVINLLLSLLVGSVVGAAIALIREQIDETITDPTDIEKRVGLPLLGTVPKTDGREPLEELRDPKSALMEAYLSVQTSLAFSTTHGVPRTLTVTSTRPAEGKSTTSFALAYVLARSGARVLLIDGDMRSPSVHSELGLKNEAGLSTFLSGFNEFQALIQTREEEPFSVMPAGPQPPNAAELLRSERLELLLKELSPLFDHVVIDSPPVMGLADAPIIASQTEATVYVVEARGVKARMARVALNRLRQGRAQLLGTVLTKFDARRAHLGYGYDYGYGYGATKRD